MSALHRLAALARGWMMSTPPTVASAAPQLGDPTPAIRIRQEAIDLVAQRTVKRASDWKIPRPPPRVAPESALMAMDDAMSGNFGWMVNSQFSEGLEFFGYPYLAELTQRAEYRRPAEIIAKAMTMKWIKIQATGEQDKSDKIKQIEEVLESLEAQDRFQMMALHDGFFGRGQLFIDMGTNREPGELKTALTVTREKIDAKGIRNLQPIEAMWSYPNQYNSNEPLEKDFFKPETWFVMGTEVHHTRLMTMVSRAVPDMLKPTYAFGGLSLTQIAKPYVDNWLRTRQSVSDLIHNFSVMALKTDLGDLLNMGTGQQIFNRADLFNRARDNRGLFLLNKESEELDNISVPLGTLDALQAQTQEHMAAVTGIPLIILFGITPSGLNATADPELKEFARTILANQENLFRRPITRVIRMIQVAKWDGWDPQITFKFEPLMPEDMKELAETFKVKADADDVLIQAGVITPQESRQRLADEEDSPYAGLDVTMVPEPPGEEGQGMGLPGLGEGGEPRPEQPPNPNPEEAGGAPNGVKPNGAGPHPFGHDSMAQDDRWITVHPHGKEVKPGQPVLIGEGGEVIGGMGGKFTGKNIKDVRGKAGAAAPAPAPPTKSAAEHASEAAEAASAHASSNPSAASHTAAQEAHFNAMQEHYHGAQGKPAGAAWEAYMRHHKQSEAHKESAEQIGAVEKADKEFVDASQKANALSETAKTSGEHLEAAKAHIAAYRAAGTAGKPQEAAEHFAKYQAHRAASAKAEKSEKRGKAKEAKASPEGKAKTEVEKRFAKHSVADIHKHFSEKYGLNFENGESGGIGRAVRNHTQIDLNSDSAAAKAMRRTLGHVDATMESLTAMGFDVKKALAKHPVILLAGSTGSSGGHAFQAHGRGYFAVNPAKITSAKFMETYSKNVKYRLDHGLPAWNAGAENYQHATIVHEMTHALGMGKPESPRRLLGILEKMFGARGSGSGGTHGQEGDRLSWIRDNISEYGTKNIKEADAELTAKVAHPSYVRGTLPKELEDHVDWLFERKGST
jgi:uncharacterized protein